MPPTLWQAVLLFALLPAVCEEVAFRGFILSGLRHMGHKWRAILISSIFFGVAHGMLQQEGSFSTARFSIEVDGVENRRLIHPVITINSQKNGDARIVAREAVLVSNPERHSLNLTVTKGVVDIEGKASMTFDDSVTYEIPMMSQEEIDKATGNVSKETLDKAMAMLREGEENLRIVKYGGGVHNKKYSIVLIDAALDNFEDLMELLE